MKRNGLLWVLASALMLCFTYTSCEEQEGLIDDKKDEKATGEEAFFPKAFADKEVAAWYSWTEKDKDKTKTEAVFLFKDNTFVVTKNKVHTDGRYERAIEATGTYELTEGDYKNGKARAIVMADNGEAAGVMNVVIEDGHLTTDQGEEVFVIQDNAKVPKASDPASGNINQGGNNNQGGNGDVNGDNAFFPKAYAGKSIEAWFAYSGSESGDGFEMKYVAAIYFFVDGSFVGTSNVAVSGPTGQSFERTVGAEGSYRIVEGNFNTGKVAITYDKDKTVILEIENGQLKAIDTEDGSVTIYIKQDNTKVPEPSDPTNNGNQGGQGGDQGDSDVPAFFPTSYAGKPVIAWYSFVTSNPVETIVEAVFLFTDNTLIVTERKIHSQDNMSEERHVWLRGSYTITSDVDYDNFTADVITDEQRKMNITSANGYLVLEYNSDMTFKRRQLKDIPDPLDSTDGYQGDDNGDDNGNEGQSDASLVAWYTSTQTYNNREYTIAIVLLDDGTVAFTSTPAADGSGAMVMTSIMGVGTYTILQGDLTNGTIRIVMYGEPQDFTASNGVVTVKEDGQEMTYYQQDNAKYDGPTDFSDYNGDDNGDDDGDDNGDDNGGDNYGYIGEITPYFPAQYADKTIAAWYLTANFDDNQVKIQAVFLFTDNTLVKTTSKFYSVNDGREPDYRIEGEGRYEIKDGDYSNGMASVVLSDGTTFDVTIEEGLMFAMNEYFAIQDNADLPAPIKAK